MELREYRRFDRWVLSPMIEAMNGRTGYNEAASVPFILEKLSTYAEIAAVGRTRFSGTTALKNALFREFRNYMRQALSNFQAAQSVPNRSAALLYYYAALNFAKAELIDVHAEKFVNKMIGHGLSFSPTNAKSVFGDYLTVKTGIFPLLYQERMGCPLAVGTRLPINRLLLQIPEIAAQVEEIGGGRSHVSGVFQLMAKDDSHSWMLLALADSTRVEDGSVTAREFSRYFEKVASPTNWRDLFGFSRRYIGGLSFFESKRKVPLTADGEFAPETWSILKPLEVVMGRRSSEEVDFWLTPSIYKTKLLPMPPSLARYALTYYASSLVRYKPQMFDGQSYPEQAHLFDAIARELALPMLQDVLSSVERSPVLFYSAGSLRN